MKHLGTKKLVTDKLILRELVIEDSKSMFNNWASSDIATRYVSWPPYKEIEAIENVLMNIHEQYQSNKYYNWGITLKESGELIGNIGLVDYSEKNMSAEIRFILGLDWWGEDYATEATKAIVNFAFEELNLHRVYAMHDVRNPAAARVMEKVGMLYEGTFREAIKDEDIYVALCQYGIVNSDNKNK